MRVIKLIFNTYVQAFSNEVYYIIYDDDNSLKPKALELQVSLPISMHIAPGKSAVLKNFF